MANYLDWQQTDFYTLLGVTQMASNKEIHKAYREKAKVYHPDKYPLDSPERKSAEKHFKLLAIAHETLTDCQKKAKYDDQLELIQACYQSAVIFDFKPIPKEEQTTRRTKFVDHLKMAAKMAEEEEETLKKQRQEEEELLAQSRPKGISDASKRSAAKAYYQQGVTYFKYKQYDRAFAAFRNAQQLDPQITIPQYVWSHLRWLAYKHY